MKWFKWGESYTSLMLGIVVVIIGVLFIASLARTHHVQETSSTSTVAATPTPTQRVYVVKQGDSLWSISETVYKTGYNWVAIAKANNLANPGSIDAGQKLILPPLMPSPTPTIVAFPTTSSTNEQAITTTTYVIHKNDTLWDIAVRAYNNGYRWVDITKANNLTNPDLIFSGNTLTIPR